MTERAWTKSLIENIIKNPKKLWKSINNYNWANNPATVFYNSNYEYIVIDNITWKIVQITNRNLKDWKVDDRIYDLINF
jgi:hypothetical protein